MLIPPTYSLTVRITHVSTHLEARTVAWSNLYILPRNYQESHLIRNEDEGNEKKTCLTNKKECQVDIRVEPNNTAMPPTYSHIFVANNGDGAENNREMTIPYQWGHCPILMGTLSNRNWDLADKH